MVNNNRSIFEGFRFRAIKRRAFPSLPGGYFRFSPSMMTCNTSVLINEKRTILCDYSKCTYSKTFNLMYLIFRCNESRFKYFVNLGQTVFKVYILTQKLTLRRCMLRHWVCITTYFSISLFFLCIRLFHLKTNVFVLNSLVNSSISSGIVLFLNTWETGATPENDNEGALFTSTLTPVGMRSDYGMYCALYLK